MDRLSAIDFTPLVVFIIRCILFFSIKSTICGFPSLTFFIVFTLIENLKSKDWHHEATRYGEYVAFNGNENFKEIVYSNKRKHDEVEFESRKRQRQVTEEYISKLESDNALMRQACMEAGASIEVLQNKVKK